MKRHSVLRLITYLFTSLITIGCADSTLPDAPADSGRVEAGTAGANRDYTLPPIVVIGKPTTCDPYIDLNFCEPTGPGDICMTSVAPGELEFASLASCPISGGPGGPGAPGTGGDGEGPDDSVERPETPSLKDFIPPTDTVPNCTQTQSASWAKAYCRASAPSEARAEAVGSALDRIAQRGGACALMAAEGRALLSSGRLQLFSPRTGDAGGWGSPTIGLLGRSIRHGHHVRQP
jgi:hypothetical protein